MIDSFSGKNRNLPYGMAVIPRAASVKRIREGSEKISKNALGEMMDP